MVLRIPFRLPRGALWVSALTFIGDLESAEAEGEAKADPNAQTTTPTQNVLPYSYNYLPFPRGMKHIRCGNDTSQVAPHTSSTDIIIAVHDHLSTTLAEPSLRNQSRH